MNAQNQALFTALADPMRRQLLMHLAQQCPKTATELARDYPITRQAILKHLDILESAGLVAVVQQGRDKRYMLTLGPLGELDQWKKELENLWEQRLMRLKGLVEDQNSSNCQ